MKRTIVILLFIIAGIYLTVTLFNVKQKESNNFDVILDDDAKIDNPKEKIKPLTIKYNVIPINELVVSSFSERNDEFIYYSNINNLEKDVGIDFLKPDICEYDANGNHVVIIQNSGSITIDYYAARSRKDKDKKYEYLTYVDQFPTLKSIPEPQFPGRDDEKMLDEYYEAMRDYWDSLEYYQIEMNIYNDDAVYNETLLLNNDDGEIICNEEYTNPNGISMIIRGYDRAYDVNSKKYMEKLVNPYVPDNYGFFKANFADEYAIYEVSGNTDLVSFHSFLDMFGEYK